MSGSVLGIGIQEGDDTSAPWSSQFRGLGDGKWEVNRFCLMSQLNCQYSLPGAIWKPSRSCVPATSFSTEIISLEKSLNLKQTKPVCPDTLLYTHPVGGPLFLSPDTFLDSCLSSPRTASPQGCIHQTDVCAPRQAQGQAERMGLRDGAGKHLEACSM